MVPNLPYIKNLLQERKWKGSDLSRHMGISRSETNRFLNGKRNGGNKVISGLLRAFPEESVKTLFLLAETYPDVNLYRRTFAGKGQSTQSHHIMHSGSLACPCCGWHRLIDTGKRTRSRTISPNDPEHPDADYYQKCPRCGEQVGIKKIE